MYKRIVVGLAIVLSLSIDSKAWTGKDTVYVKNTDLVIIRCPEVLRGYRNNMETWLSLTIPWIEQSAAVGYIWTGGGSPEAGFLVFRKTLTKG